jgi:hypothetical protein
VNGACSTHERHKKPYKVLVRKPEDNRHLGSPRSRWENNIKMDLQK